MAFEHINKLDSLNKGRVKLNNAIDGASEAKEDAVRALAKSLSAEQIAQLAQLKSDDTQQQLDNIIIESGTSDAEVIQARGNEPLLKDRLNKTDQQLAVNVTKEVESTGYGVLNGLKVSSRPTPNMTVNVVAGTVHMPDGKSFTLSSPTVLTIPDSGAVARTDIVFINETGQLSYSKGSTDTPTIPNGSVLLAEIKVGAGATYVDGRNVIDKRKIKQNNVKLTERFSEFKNFPNTDGAVTNLINTGLTYTGIDDFVYGNSHTLFNDDTSKQNGKWVIDCSAFIQACLEGITFQNSKYQNEENTRQDSPFLFPNEAKSESDGRMLANDLARYAYENGYAYDPLDDYSNVRVGDIIFWHNSPQPHFWRGIGHVQMVINTSRKGYITLLHSYENAEKAVQQNEYTISKLRSEKAFTCARFPLKDSHNGNLLMNLESKAVTTTTTNLLRPLKFIEPLQERQMYTIFMTFTPDSLDSYPLIRLLDETTIYSFWDKGRNPDGVYKSSFYISKGELDKNTDLTRANLFSTNPPGGTVGYFGLYKGYISEFNELDDLEITETGLNSNGKYIKFPDGTLICRHTVTQSDMLPQMADGAIYRSESKSWVYPHSFYDIPDVMVDSNFESRWATRSNTPTLTSCKYNLLSTISSNQPGSVTIIAIGRWKE